MAELATSVVVYWSEPLLQLLFPVLIAGIEQIGYRIEVIAEVTVASQNVPKGMVAELPIPVNPLIYSYGLPLALALILAFTRTLRNIIISILVFLLIQIWGICFESLKVLFLQTPAELLGNIKLPGWQLDIIALGYQLGALILPAVTPVIIWVWFYKDFIAGFVPAMGKR
nr:exosortase H-associated membrane protein [Bathymodiolus japonicus methanotrophic gill symbiont]